MIIYSKLRNILKSRGLRYIDLGRELNLSPSMVAKFSKNRTLSTDTINRVCEYFHVQPSEIMEWIPDEEYSKQNAEKAEIEAQIAALQEKLKNL